MLETASALAIAVIVLGLAGAPLGIALTRSVAVGLVLAPVLASLSFTFGAVTAIVLGAPLVPCLVLWIGASFVLAIWMWRRGTVLADLDVKGGAVVVIALVMLPALMTVFRAPVGWDARTTWWFHAEWMEEGGNGFADAVTNDAVSWAHADYPPLASATVAAVRSLGPDTDGSRTAQATTAVTSWAALVLVAVALCACFRDGSPMMNGLFCGVVALSFSAFLTGDRGLTSGYVDYLWASLLGAAAILLLTHRPTRSSALVGAICITAVALTKNEGLLCAALLAAVAVARHRAAWRRYWIVAAALVPGIGWAVLVRALGAESDMTTGAPAAGASAGDGDVLSRLSPTLEAIRDLDYTVPFIALLLGAALTAVLASTALTPVRQRMRVGSDLWMWLLIGGVVSVMVSAYLASPYGIDWHLNTSLNRTMLAPALLLLVSMATWLRVALQSLRRDQPASPRR